MSGVPKIYHQRSARARQAVAKAGLTKRATGHTFRWVFAVRLTGFEAIGEILMPIRIRCRDKLLDRAQPMEDKGISATPAGAPTACYMDGKPELRTLCGSV
jgi:hypothetical protein